MIELGQKLQKLEAKIANLELKKAIELNRELSVIRNFCVLVSKAEKFRSVFLKTETALESESRLRRLESETKYDYFSLR